jgi:hypothetical protein
VDNTGLSMNIRNMLVYVENSVELLAAC